jgi:hypothetical protein
MSDDDSDFPEQDAEPGGRGILPKSLHKALVTGVSAVLMTEEGIRNALGDLRLPKEAIGYVIAQTEKSRKDLFQAVTTEIKRYLENVDVSTTLRKALTGLHVEVKADIRFIDDNAVETHTETKVHAPEPSAPEADEDAAPPADATPRRGRGRKK